MSYPGTVKSKQDVEEEKKKEELKKLIGDGTDIDNLGLKYIKKQWTAAEYMQYVEKFLPRIKHQVSDGMHLGKFIIEGIFNL